MLLLAAVCFIIERHREARAVETGRANSQSEHENASHLMEMGSGRTDTTDSRGISSEEILKQEPPPAYMQAGTTSWRDDVEGFQVSGDGPLQGIPHRDSSPIRSRG